MRSACTFRPVLPADLAWAARVNATAVPHVNLLSEAEMAALVDSATGARIAVIAGEACALLLTFAAGDRYASGNFRWFERWHARFLYIDRIIVDPAHRRRGVARAVYADLAAAARSTYAALVCEVNLAPANPVSLAFHQACGFQSLCARYDKASAKTVLMLRKPLF